MKKFLSSLPIIILFLSLEVPCLIYGMYWQAITIFIFGICFGVTEVIADKVSGMTLSQHFWALKEKNRKGAIVITIGMILAWVMLLTHFWWH